MVLAGYVGGDILSAHLTFMYFSYSLRLQGLKSCRLVEGSMGKDDTGMDLSWAISVANLSTATVNFDLLTKRPTASIEVAASNFSDEKISSNAGVFKFILRLLQFRLLWNISKL